MMIGLSFLFACQQDDLAPDANAPSVPHDRDGEMIKLGKELENPYSVENMRKAYANLTSNGRLTENVDIETTHYYVRFLPTDTAEVAVLDADTTLELFDHPLLFEIEQAGHWYHDPSIADSLPTWQYTVVGKDYGFPAMRYEKLADLFMVDNDSATAAANGRISATSWDELEYEALRITNNLDDAATKGAANGRMAASKWNPRGKIMVEERIGVDLRDVPLRYCRVRARKLLKWASTNTSVTDGQFYISTDFRDAVNYSLEFETAGFKVTDALGLSANYNGPKLRGPWNLDIAFSADSKSWPRATVLNAIYHFRTEAYRHNLKLPGLLTTIKVRPVFDPIFDNSSSNVIWTVFRHSITAPTGHTFLKNDVKILTHFSNGNHLGTDALYRVTMHELGHISHYLKSPANFDLSDGMTRESWAEAVEYYFTLPYYPLIVALIPDRDRADIIGTGDHWKYTPFFIDLRDNTNQRASPTDTHFADDDVENYTLEQMQNALDHRTRLEGVCGYLRDNYNNSSEHNLPKLLEFYEDIKDHH